MFSYIGGDQRQLLVTHIKEPKHFILVTEVKVSVTFKSP